MIRNLRILRLAVVALLMTGAMGASAAHAAEFHTENGSGATITGELPSEGEIPSEEEAFVFHVNHGIAPCLAASFDGVMAKKTESALTLTPKFSKCILGSTTMGACDFVLHASGTFDIGGGASCAPEPIEVNMGCKIKIGPQQELSGISYVNGGSGAKRDMTATFSVSQIHYTQVGGVCKGGAGTFANGKLTGIATLRADILEGGAQQGLWVE